MGEAVLGRLLTGPTFDSLSVLAFQSNWAINKRLVAWLRLADVEYTELKQHRRGRSVFQGKSLRVR